MGEPNTGPGQLIDTSGVDRPRPTSRRRPRERWEFDAEAMNAVVKDLQASLDNDYSQAQNEAAWLTRSSRLEQK
jgi:hypothetical protein